MDVSRRPTRRDVLRTGGVIATGLVVGSATTATVGGQQQVYGGYLSGEGTWGGVTIEAFDVETVTVAVGAEGNGGFHAFDPAAIAIEPGTTVEWEWTGSGGGHDVVHDNAVPGYETDQRVFNSEAEHGGGTTSEAGFVYECTFDPGMEGVYPYFCSPHLDSPMVGVVVVGEQHVETDTIQLADYEPLPREGDDGTDGFAFGFGPGFGVAGAVAGIGGLGYLLVRQLRQRR